MIMNFAFSSLAGGDRLHLHLVELRPLLYRCFRAIDARAVYFGTARLKFPDRRVSLVRLCGSPHAGLLVVVHLRSDVPS